jgi:hypothetical protein
MHFDVDSHIIFLTLTGSHAYGMSRPESDVDVRGVVLPPKRITLSFYKEFNQFESDGLKEPIGRTTASAFDAIKRHPTAGHSFGIHKELDFGVFNIIKFFKLASNANPNIFELLFVDEREILFSSKPWERVLAQRDLFLTKKVKHTYTGYANSQLGRIKRHRAWLLNPPKEEPTRKAFGLPEESTLPADLRNTINESVENLIRQWNLEDGIELTGAAQDVVRERIRSFHASALQCKSKELDDKIYEIGIDSLGLTRDVMAALKAERKYRAARQHWNQYQNWKKHRNEKRAALEADFGYDTKHASHLIRLLRSGLEILRDKKVLVRRPDAELLLDIRRGKFSYDEIIEMGEGLQKEIADIYMNSELPKSPDLERIDLLLFNVLTSYQ